jgi:hypothetical protein
MRQFDLQVRPKKYICGEELLERFIVNKKGIH